MQDKLARSRLQHFVSIIFDRPPTRDKSVFERALLAVLYPAAVVLLFVAVYEVLSSTFSANHRSGNLLDETTISQPKEARLLPPYLLEGLAVLFLSIGWALWPSSGTDVEVVDPDPISDDNHAS